MGEWPSWPAQSRAGAEWDDGLTWLRCAMVVFGGEFVLWACLGKVVFRQAGFDRIKTCPTPHEDLGGVRFWAVLR